MTDLDRLLAIEAIKQLKAKYFRCVDTKDWVGFRSVFADDVVFDISQDMPDGGLITGGDAVVATVSRSLTADVTSVHHGHCPEIEILSATTATGIWAMEDMLSWGPDGAHPGQTLHGMGHYHETYEKSGSWRIKTMKLTRLRTDFAMGNTAG
ncbi:MAG TPA: nuclear transport factor 2 family protein [Novosphingobium sp.]